MIPIKGLCVLFFLYLSIDKSQNLKSISSSAKRTNNLADEVNQNADNIGVTIKAKLRTPENKFIGHSAYIYLQPQNSQGVIYDNTDVQNVFGSTEVTQMTVTVWPDQGEESNFRMAVPVKGAPASHAEAQLLGQTNDGLKEMIHKFNAATTSCPRYVIFYSLLLPCEDCASKIIGASSKLKNHGPICKGTPFYLYVQKPEYTKEGGFFNKIRNYLIDASTGIIWSNDPGPRM